MRHLISASIALILVSVCIVAEEKYPGPRCLGPFCADRYDSGATVFERIGHPKSNKLDLYCYKARDGSGFVAVELTDHSPRMMTDVFLSDFQHCWHMPEGIDQVTPENLKNWRTPEGIGLGSSEQDVIKAYGKPTDTLKTDVRYVAILLGLRPRDTAPDVGTKSLEYGIPSDRTRAAEFGIRNGKVAWIAMFR
jgi:hypothetical protein